jgi:hypothetical protein
MKYKVYKFNTKDIKTTLTMPKNLFVKTDE